MTLDEIKSDLTPKVSVTYNGRTVEMVRAGTQWNDIERVKGQFGLLSSARDYIAKRSDFPEGSEPRPKDYLIDGSTRWRVYTLADEECWRPLGNESTGLIRIHVRK